MKAVTTIPNRNGAKDACQVILKKTQSSSAAGFGLGCSCRQIPDCFLMSPVDCDQECSVAGKCTPGRPFSGVATLTVNMDVAGVAPMVPDSDDNATSAPTSDGVDDDGGSVGNLTTSSCTQDGGTFGFVSYPCCRFQG
jgi:hypothetical protein